MAPAQPGGSALYVAYSVYGRLWLEERPFPHSPIVVPWGNGGPLSLQARFATPPQEVPGRVPVASNDASGPLH